MRVFNKSPIQVNIPHFFPNTAPTFAVPGLPEPTFVGSSCKAKRQIKTADSKQPNPYPIVIDHKRITNCRLLPGNFDLDNPRKYDSLDFQDF